MSGINLMIAAICLNITCDSNTNLKSENKVDYNIGLNSLEGFHNKHYVISKLRNSLNGKILKVGTLEDFPLSYTEIKDRVRIGKGVSFDIINFLAEKFNFTYEVSVPSKNIIGSTNDMEGSLLELVENKKVDMVAAFIPLISDARSYISYSSTTLDEGEWIMIMLRPSESATGSGLLAPFETEVWILILISLVSVGPIIYILVITRMKLTRDKSQKPYGLNHCAWFVYGALMKQGSTLSPIADSIRLLFATWWIFITILTSFYTANLTAFLTLSKFTLPINNVADILRKDKQFVTQRGGGVEYAIKNPDEPLNILNRMVQRNRAVFSDNENGLDVLTAYVEKNNYVYVRDRPAINHLMYADYLYRKSIDVHEEKVHCPFAVSKAPFLKKKRAFAYAHNMNWSYLFDVELLYLVEAGIVKYMTWEKLPQTEICPPDLGGTERQLRNGDLLMTYYIIFAGFATGIICFITEMVFNQLQIKLYIKRQYLVNTSYAFQRGFASYNQKTSRNGEQMDKMSWTVKPINGREYIVYQSLNGRNILIPTRAASATLFEHF